MPVYLPEYLFIFFIGSALGSFLNVVIYRVPRDESIVSPGSHCPKCNRPIKPYENIPILSFVFLKGKCAGCGSGISVRYPVVEASMGILSAMMLWKFGWGWQLLFYCTMAAVLLALSVIDIDVFRLPNKIVLTGSIFAVIITLLVMREHILDMIFGGLIGLGLLGLMGLIGRLLFHKETLGMGDIKLSGMIGLYLGPWLTAGMYIIAVFIGAVVGLTLIAVGGKKWGSKIPFGPYLALGSIVTLLWGKELWGWYLAMILH
ncbi:MAG: prepilin peptidase [Calditrichaeota bacterium]|nr:prepilin peptidase [Calditrichota bacterium]